MNIQCIVMGMLLSGILIISTKEYNIFFSTIIFLIFATELMLKLGESSPKTGSRKQ